MVMSILVHIIQILACWLLAQSYLWNQFWIIINDPSTNCDNVIETYLFEMTVPFPIEQWVTYISLTTSYGMFTWYVFALNNNNNKFMNKFMRSSEDLSATSRYLGHG